jgi:3-oxoacyl-[acyl-carrier protein] reductase
MRGKNTMSDLTGKVVVVTGASKGIGAGIARAFGAVGATVVVNYATSKEGADKIVGEIVSSQKRRRNMASSMC